MDQMIDDANRLADEWYAGVEDSELYRMVNEAYTKVEDILKRTDVARAEHAECCIIADTLVDRCVPGWADDDKCLLWDIVYDLAEGVSPSLRASVMERIGGLHGI